MINTTVDKSVTIKAERGLPLAEQRDLFGANYECSRLVLTAQIEGVWPSKAALRDELEALADEIFDAFDAQM